MPIKPQRPERFCIVHHGPLTITVGVIIAVTLIFTVMSIVLGRRRKTDDEYSLTSRPASWEREGGEDLTSPMIGGSRGEAPSPPRAPEPVRPIAFARRAPAHSHGQRGGGLPGFCQRADDDPAAQRLAAIQIPAAGAGALLRQRRAVEALDGGLAGRRSPRQAHQEGRPGPFIHRRPVARHREAGDQQPVPEEGGAALATGRTDRRAGGELAGARAGGGLGGRAAFPSVAPGAVA